MKRVFHIGTRDSRLARWQTDYVINLLKAVDPDLPVTVVPIKTTGDRVGGVPLDKIGSAGLFTKEIEKALIDGTIDAAVHSLKDLESELPEGLTIGAVPIREDVRDVLISRTGTPLENLMKGARIYTGSPRRKAQLLNLRNDFCILNIRGNIETRLKKFHNSDADALIMAAAGINRLELTKYIAAHIPVETMLPAVGQGALVIEVRKRDKQTIKICSKINNKTLHLIAAAERCFLKTLQGGCQVPIGGLGKVDKETLELIGLVAAADGSKLIKKSIHGDVSEAEHLGKQLAENILSEGGREILESLR